MIRIAALLRYEDTGKNRRRTQETHARVPGCVSVLFFDRLSKLSLYPYR